jgi:hypothetical protein
MSYRRRERSSTVANNDRMVDVREGGQPQWLSLRVQETSIFSGGVGVLRIWRTFS